MMTELPKINKDTQLKIKYNTGQKVPGQVYIKVYKTTLGRGI